MTEQNLYDYLNLRAEVYLKDTEYLKTSFRQFCKFNSIQNMDRDNMRKVAEEILDNAEKFYRLNESKKEKEYKGMFDEIRGDILIQKIYPSVTQTRKELFGSEDAPFLLDMESAANWIKQKAAEPIPEDIKRKKENFQKICDMYFEGLKNNEIHGSFGLSTELLDFPGQEGWVERVASSDNPLLNKLQQQVKSISNATGFPQYMITCFILTDMKPSLVRYRLKHSINSSCLPSGEWINRDIVNFEINASDLTFSEIKEIYDKYKTSLNTKRQKSITPKQKELLSLVTKLGDVPINGKGTKEYWERAKESWNELFPGEKERYDSWEGIRKAYVGLRNKIDL